MLNKFFFASAGVVGFLLVWVGSAAIAADDSLGLGDPGRAVKLTVVADASQPESSTATIVGRGQRLQLIVSASYDSGQIRDWTRKVKYEVSPAGVLTVDQQGRVTALTDGTATIRVSGEGDLAAEVTLGIEQFNNPPPTNFPNRITPIFTKLGCNGGGCHGKSGGQNGFSLSLLGFEPAEDYVYLVKEGRGRRVFPAAPDKSLLLQKAIGRLPHGGGMRMSSDSDEYQLIRLWIEQGMPYGSDDDPQLTGIRVFPRQRTLPRNGSQQLKVTAHFSDGSSRDVTAQAQYEANDKEIADAAESGLVEMLGNPGEVAIMVRYQGQVDAFRATVPLGAPVESLPPSRNFIDELVFGKLKDLGLPPSPVCNDSTFLRRATIDLAGRIPTLEETQQFLADSDPGKRAKLIDRLLDSNDYADLFAQKWSAILRNKVEQNVDRSGNYRFHDWVRSSLLANKPFDQFAREIITASGDVRYNPAVNWHRHVKTIEEKVEDAAQVFLGLRIQCARCHHHPFEKWSQHDYWGMAAFFANVREKNNEFVYVARGVAQSRHPRSGEMIRPTGLDSEPMELTADDDARLALADWMTRPDNRFFSRAIVNRYWKHFFGRGIVDPEDDMRATNPPSNPELLDALADNFVENHFDLKQLVRTICGSSAYQLSAIPNQYNASDRQSFSRFTPRRLHAEVMLDGIDQLLGTTTGYSGLPRGTRAVQIPDHGGVNNSFLNIFGRPAGASACECERSGEMTMAQSLQLLNSSDMYGKLDGSRARKLAADPRADEDKITEVYLRAFCRKPTSDELDSLVTHLSKFEPNLKYQAYEDILWTLMNTKEFMFNH